MQPKIVQNSLFFQDWKIEEDIQAWFDEHQDFPRENVENFSPNSDGSVTGHYTQLVWAATEYIGCGAIYYKDENSEFPYRKTFVCNYFPAGNWLNEKVYKIGETGSSCENEVENGLCI